MAHTAIQRVGARGSIECDGRCTGNVDIEDVGCRQIAGIHRSHKHADRPGHTRCAAKRARRGIEA